MYLYTESGLQNIFLKSGYNIRQIDGEEAVSICEIEELTTALVWALITGKPKLNGRDVRFIRVALEWTQRELAKNLEESEQTVSLWERGKSKDIPTRAALLFRVAVISTLKPDLEIGSAFGVCKNAVDGVGSEIIAEYDANGTWRVNIGQSHSRTSTYIPGKLDSGKEGELLANWLDAISALKAIGEDHIRERASAFGMYRRAQHSQAPATANWSNPRSAKGGTRRHLRLVK